MKKIALSPELIIRAKNKAGDLKKFTQELNISRGFNNRYRLSDEAYDALEKGMTGKFKDIQEAGRVYDRTGIYAGKTAPAASKSTKSRGPRKKSKVTPKNPASNPGMINDGDPSAAALFGVGSLAGAAAIGTSALLEKAAGFSKLAHRYFSEPRKMEKNADVYLIPMEKSKWMGLSKDKKTFIAEGSDADWFKIRREAESQGYAPSKKKDTSIIRTDGKEGDKKALEWLAKNYHPALDD